MLDQQSSSETVEQMRKEIEHLRPYVEAFRREEARADKLGRELDDLRAAAQAPGKSAGMSQLDDASNACLELAAKHGFATGHGDTVGDMIREFSAQIPGPAYAPLSHLQKACYVMSEKHLSGYRLVLGFETLADAQAAHEAIAQRQPKSMWQRPEYDPELSLIEAVKFCDDGSKALPVRPEPGVLGSPPGGSGADNPTTPTEDHDAQA
jgi:hypothetical protein